jgi:hypothetical protein
MNMNNDPTLEQLQQLLSACDDEAGNHCLWVAADGEVSVSLLPEALGPIGFEANTPSMRLRYETFCEGNGYVGLDAAADDSLTKPLLRALISMWVAAKDQTTVSYFDVL